MAAQVKAFLAAPAQVFEIQRVKRIPYPHPEFKFKDLSANEHVIYYVIIDNMCYIRAVDLWRSLTKSTGNHGMHTIDIDGEVKKVLFDKTTGCPSTRPVYALTINQAIKASYAYSAKHHRGVLLPVERWLRNDLYPAAKKLAPGMPALPAIAHSPALPAEPQKPAPVIAAPLPQITTTLTPNKDGNLSYMLQFPANGLSPRKASGKAWRLSPVKLANTDQEFWPERIGIDVKEIKSIFEIGQDDIGAILNRLWSRKGADGQIFQLVDKTCWAKMKEIPYVSSKTAYVNAFDELFALGEAYYKENKTIEPEDVAKTTEPDCEEKHDDTPAHLPVNGIENPIESRTFEYVTLSKRNVFLCIGIDNENKLWISRRPIEFVFGGLKDWSDEAKNCKRRVLVNAEQKYQAICESSLCLLRGHLNNKDIAEHFQTWLDGSVRPKLMEQIHRETPGVDAKEMQFFFMGITHSVHVGKDENGDLWASSVDIENIFDLPMRSWPHRARQSPMRAMSYDGKSFPCIMEEWLEVIAASAPPSRKGRAKGFTSWWTDKVWPTFNPVEKSPEKTGKTLTELAREAARLLLELADANDDAHNEIANLRAEREAWAAQRAVIEGQAKQFQETLGKLLKH
jgi:prophage antirepressor-like protein